MSIQALREQRKAAAASARELLENSKDRAWTSDDDTVYNNILADIDRIDASIEREEKVLDIEAATASKIDTRTAQFGVSADEAADIVNRENKVFRAWLTGGVQALTYEDQQFVAKRARDIRNAMSTGTGSEGGFLVPNEFSANLVEALKAYGGMRSVANVIPTESGASMDIPTTDATSEEGELVGENASVTNADATFGTKSLDVYKYSSKSIAVPFELLQDSAIDLEAHINTRLRDRLGRITNKHFTIGTGTGQPNGVVTASAVGKVGTTGQTSSIIYDDLVDLEHSVDPAYREMGDCSFMFHDDTLKELRKLKDADNRPLWAPGIVDGAPETINGRRFTINQHMPTMAANAKSVLFGDFSKYWIRDVMQVLLFRMTDSKYTEKGQVGFLAFMRSGGQLTDVGGAIKHYANSAT